MKIRVYHWNKQVPTDETRILDIERSDLNNPPDDLTPDKVLSFAPGYVRKEFRDSEIALFEGYVLRNRVDESGPYGEHIRAMSDAEMREYIRGKWHPARLENISVEAATRLLVNGGLCFRFRDLPEPVRRVMLALPRYVECWSTDMREWQRAGNPQNWENEAYRLPPHVAAFAVGFMGTSENGNQGWHKYLMAALTAGLITDNEFNQLRQIPHLLNEAGIKAPSDGFLFFAGKAEDATVPG